MTEIPLHLSRLSTFNRYEGWSPLETLEERLSCSMEALTKANLDVEAAKMALAGVTYLSRSELNLCWKFCGMELEGLLRKLHVGYQNVYWLQVENEEHVTRFFSANRYPGRSEPVLVPPVRHIEGIWSLIKNVLNSPETEDCNRLRYLIERPIWIILWDLNLSGKTILKELERLKRCRCLLPEKFRRSKKIVVLSAVSTQPTINKLSFELHKRDINNVFFITGLMLIRNHTISSHNMISSKTQKRIKEFCREFHDWAVAGHYPPDISLKNIGPCGFDNGGYLIVTQENTPNNSLPFLWYSTDTYSPPFPRNSSRILGHLSHPPRDLDALSDESIEKISRLLSSSFG